LQEESILAVQQDFTSCAAGPRDGD
jgi:hypothetical protein